MTEQLYTNIPPLRPCMCGHGDHYQINGRCLTPDCGCAGRTIDMTGASDAEFRARVAAFDAAPVPDEVVVAGEQRDRLAEALHTVGTRPGFTELDAWTRWTTIAAAAIAALPPSPAEEALREFAEWVLSITDDPPARRTVTLEQIIQRAALACDPDLRAALASPAPAPQGEEGAR